MDQVQVLKAEDFFCIPFVNLHFRLNSTVQLWFCASSRPPAVKRIMFSRPGEFWNADEVHNHSSMCRTESDTWTTSRSPCLLLLPGEQLLDSREPLDTHILDPATSYSHTHYFHYRRSEWKRMLYMSVCQLSDPSFIWMETGKVEFFLLFCPLQLNTSLLLLYISLPSPPPSLVRPSPSPFFIASLGELAGPTINEFSVFTLVSGFLSSFSRHIYSGFTFSKSCLIFTLLTFFFCIYLFLHLSPIFTSIYLSQFCLEEEVSHFPPHF